MCSFKLNALVKEEKLLGMTDSMVIEVNEAWDFGQIKSFFVSQFFFLLLF